jgi:hypothetical protein
MAICVLLNDKGEFVNTIVTDSTEWYDPTWTLIPIPEGYYWNGKEVTKIKDPSVTPVVI